MKKPRKKRHLKLRMFFRLDELTVKLVATVRWAIKLYRVCF